MTRIEIDGVKFINKEYALLKAKQMVLSVEKLEIVEKFIESVFWEDRANEKAGRIRLFRY